MKPSHLRTPRTLEEGTFVPGYRRADRDPVQEIGDRIVTLAALLILVVMVPLVVFGVL